MYIEKKSQILTPKNFLLIIIGILIGILTFYIFLDKIPLDKVWVSLKNAKIEWVFLSSIFLTLACLTKALRWWFILKKTDEKLSLAGSIWPYTLSIFINAILPLRLGDIFRIFHFRKYSNCKFSSLVGSLIFEKFLDLLTLLLFLLLIIMIFYNKVYPSEIFGATFNFSIYFVLFGLLLISFFFYEKTINFFKKSYFSHFTLYKIIIKYISDILNVSKLFTNGKEFFIIIFFSILGWFFEGLLFSCVIISLGFDTYLIGSWLGFVLATLSMALPTAPAGIGSFHFGAMMGLLLDGSTEQVAGAFAFLSHSIYFLTLTLMVILLFLLRILYRFKFN